MNIETSTKMLQLNTSEKIIDDDKELATNFNYFFVNVGPSTENTILKVPNILPTVAHISNEEILDIISSLENKSIGPSNIPMK